MASFKNLTIPNTRGEKLVGVLDDTNSIYVVVLCHGFLSSKDDAVLINISSDFVSKGISTYRFDFSGSGESEGEFRYGDYWKDAEDIRCVICYIRSIGRKVDVIIGHSKGGNAVLLYAAKYKDVAVVVNISGRFYLKRGIRKRLGNNFSEVIEKQGYLDVKDRYGNFIYRVTKDSLNERLNTNVEGALTSITECCRVLTVHGSKDETVNCEESKEFDRFIMNHKLVILEDADHYFRQHQRLLAFVVLDFVMGTNPEFKCTNANQISSVQKRDSEKKLTFVSRL